jgi:hypothetical protein
VHEKDEDYYSKNHDQRPRLEYFPSLVANEIRLDKELYTG